MDTTLGFLKAELSRLDAQIAPLKALRSTLLQQINRLETSGELAKYNLSIGDALKLTPECAQYCRLTISEFHSIPNETLYISGLNFDQVMLSIYPEGGGVAYAATLEMAQRMKAAQS